MGNSASEFANAEPVQLTRNNAFTVFGEEYCYDRPLDLVMKEKIFSFSGDDFSINDAQTQQPMFRIKGKAFSFRDKKKIVDLQGRTIGQIKEKHLTAHKRMYIMDTNEKIRVVVRKAAHFQLSARAEAWILNTPLSLDDMNKEET